MANIKAVIFDMDGVLTETSEMHYIAWKEMAHSIGIEIDRAFNETLKGVSRRASLEKILAHGGVLDQYNEKAIEKLMEDKNEHYVALINQYSEKDLNPGILDLLRDLQEAGIKMGVASASRSAPFLVERLGIGPFISYIVDPTTVPGKPSPDLFLAVAKALRVAPSEALGIEDAAAGVAAIKAANMTAIGVGDPQVLKEADLVVQSTDQLSLALIKEAYDHD